VRAQLILSSRGIEIEVGVVTLLQPLEKPAGQEGSRRQLFVPVQS